MTTADLMAKMRGVFIPLATPFDDTGEIDYVALQGNIQNLMVVCQGRDFVFVPAGTTGEASSLSSDEHQEVVATVVNAVAGRFPVIAGASAPGTKEAVRLGRLMQQAGVDGILVVPPYYTIANEEGVFRHYKEIAERLNIGIVVYNNPSVSGSWISPSLMSRLAEIDNIIASKENTPFVMNYLRMWQQVDPSKLVVLCGLGELMYAFVGPYECPGFFSGRVGNIAPQVSYEFFEAIKDNNVARAYDLLTDLSPYFQFFDRMEKKHPASTKAWWGGGGTMLFSVIKAAMDLLGFQGGGVRTPLTDIGTEDRRELAEILAHVECLKRS